MSQLTAPRIFHPEGWLENHLLEVDPDGTVLALRPLQSSDRPQSVAGILAPGLVNAHCHLELSMLKGQIAPGSGMVDFVGQVVRKRNDFSEAEQIEAAERALEEMQEKGIVGLGDISNSPLTASLKAETVMRVHTFVEVLGLRAEQATEILERGRGVAAAFEGQSVNLSPHAPYSMSGQLLDQLYASGSDRLSLHLLESQAERALFDQQVGPFLSFYEALHLPPPDFPEGGALAHALRDQAHDRPYLFVHLTEATPQELAQLVAAVPQAWFCLCPLSNLYIHDRFPEIGNVTPYAERVCLGTDSLASNWQLDIWAEVREIHRRYPEIEGHTLLRWATWNGACALGMEEQMGSFRIGTRPGVLHVDWEAGTASPLRIENY